MNLIEQLGGYEAAKSFLKEIVDNKSPYDILSRELLSYRRANNFFELNDWILTNNQDFSEEPCQLVEDCSFDFKYKTKSGHWGFIVKSFLPNKWRHATDEEIEAGKRLDSLKEAT